MTNEDLRRVRGVIRRSSASPKTMRQYNFYVYLMSSKSGVLYVGVTNDLARRVAEHRASRSGFAGKYKVRRLVFFEYFRDIRDAIAREKPDQGLEPIKKARVDSATESTFCSVATPPELNVCHSDEFRRTKRLRVAVTVQRG